MNGLIYFLQKVYCLFVSKEIFMQSVVQKCLIGELRIFSAKNNFSRLIIMPLNLAVF